MSFTPLKNPTKPQQGNYEAALFANVQALMAQVSDVALDNKEIDVTVDNKTVKRGPVYIDKEGNLHIRMTSVEQVNALKNHLSETGFTKNSLFTGDNNEVVLSRGSAFKFCTTFGGLNIEESKALFKKEGMNDETLKKLFRDFELYSLLTPSSPVQKVVLMSADEMKNKALSMGFDTPKGIEAFKELYTSEASYIEALRRIGSDEKESILRVYDALSSSDKKGFISKEEFSKLLDSYAKLAILEQKLFAEIEQNPLNIQKMLPELQESYSQYIQQFQAMKTKGGIPKELNTVYMQDPNFAGKSLEDFLVQPTQRIMRYGMLYSAMNERLPDDHPNKAAYKDLISNIGSGAKTVDSGVKAINLEKSEMVVSLDLDKSEVERRRTKSLLRGFDSHNTTLSDSEQAKQIQNQANSIGLQGYVIEEKKKSLIERATSPKEAEFIIKSSKNNEPVFSVVINEGKITVKELKAGSLSENSYQQQLKDLNKLMQVLKGNIQKQPVISSKSTDAAVALKQIGINNKLINYRLSSKTKKSMETKVSDEASTSAITVSKSVPVLKIDYDDAKAKYDPKGNLQLFADKAINQERDRLRNELQTIVNEGTVVPELKITVGGVSTSQSSIGYDGNAISANPIKITTTQPLLAIKQFEAILAAGFTPKLEGKAAENVAKYVKEGVSSNFEEKLKEPGKELKTEKHIKISGPLSANGKIDGAEVLRRVRIATQNGFMVDLSPDEKLALKFHIGNLPAKELAEKCEISMPKGPEPVMMMRNLLDLGVMPIVTVPAKALKDSVKKGEPLGIVKIDSGNVEQDFKILKTALGQLGMQVSVDGLGIKKHVKDHPQVTQIDLSNFAKSDQLKQAQQLANMGVSCILTTPVPLDTLLFITSLNPKHAVQMFEKALNQGFKPSFNSAIQPDLEKLLQNSSQTVKIEGSDPKVIFDRVKQSMEVGLVPTLTPQQQKTLKDYAVKNELSLTVQGYHSDAIKANVELANKLNIGVEVRPEAQQVNQSSVEKSKEPPSISIYPFEKEKTRFFFFKTKEIDFDRTLKHVQKLQEAQFYFHNSDDMKAAMEVAKTVMDKKRLFGGLTKKAKEMQEKFYKPFMERQSADEARKIVHQSEFKSAPSQVSAPIQPSGVGRVHPVITPKGTSAAPITQPSGTVNPQPPQNEDRNKGPKVGPKT